MKKSESVEPFLREQLKAKLDIAISHRSADRCHAVIDWYFQELYQADNSDDSPPLEYIGIPADIADAFYENGVFSVDDLCLYSQAEILDGFANIGGESLRIVNERLASCGLSLRV